MLSRSTQDNRSKRADAGNSRLRVRSMMLAALVVVLCLAHMQRQVLASDGEGCSETLERVAAEEFQENSLAKLDGVCAEDVRSYLSFVGFVLMSKSEPTGQELQDRLLRSGESGYLSAKIIYTLVFTDIFDSKFSREFFSKQSYSRYAPYIISLRLVGEWRQDRIVDKLFVASEFANEAVRQGVVEAYLLKHFFNYVQYKSGNNNAFKKDAAVSLLTLADFLNKIEVARQYLTNFLAMDRAELESFEVDSRSTVNRILADPENSACRQDKGCALGLNIKRVICDIRDRNGQRLYRIGEPNCARLSESLIRLHRQTVEQAFEVFISARKP